MGSWLKTPTPWNLWNFLKKDQRPHIQIKVVTLKMASYRTMRKNKKWKESENLRFNGQKNFFCYPILQPLGSLSHMAIYKSSLKNTRKVNLQPIFNKISPWTLMASQFDVLGVAKKLIKWLVHMSKRKEKILIFFFSWCAQTPNYQFLVSRNSRD
jgi:hypothetical protein